MAKWYEAANEASFKQVAGGYVFQCPSPWMVARPIYYRVNEVQKAEIFAAMGRWRLALLGSLALNLAIPGSLVAFVHLAPKTFVKLAAPALQFGTGVFAVLLFAALMFLLLPVIAAPQIYLNRALRKVLADAPLTDERITVREQLPKAAQSASGTLLAIGMVGVVTMIVAGVFGLIEAYAEGHLVRSLFFPFLPTVAFGGLMGFYFMYLIRLKAKLKRAAA